MFYSIPFGAVISDSQVEALVFLAQFTDKVGEEAAFTPYRIKITMIDTDQGWLVSDVETD